MLDEPVIEKILSKLALTYGVRFHAQYEGMAPDMVRANWRKELGDISREGIEYATANLPEKFPPNVLEFRRLCHSRRTEASRLLLPPPRPRGMDDKVRERIAAIGAQKRDLDPKGWARKLRMRELACENLTPTQRAMWRAALGSNALPPEEEK